MKSNVLQTSFGADQAFTCQASLSDRKEWQNFPVEVRDFYVAR